MKTAKTVLEADQKATNEVQQNLETLTTNKAFMKKITQDIVKSSGSIVHSSYELTNLLMKSGNGLFTRGLETTAKLFGDDISREMSKLILVASGRIVTGSVTVVMGGLTMGYDIYKLTSQIEILATKSIESSAEELKEIANKLEESLQELHNAVDGNTIENL